MWRDVWCIYLSKFDEVLGPSTFQYTCCSVFCNICNNKRITSLISCFAFRFYSKFHRLNHVLHSFDFRPFKYSHNIKEICFSLQILQLHFTMTNGLMLVLYAREERTVAQFSWLPQINAQYCLNGIITGECAANFFCRSGLKSRTLDCSFFISIPQ